jgi:hypothetical protein
MTTAAQTITRNAPETDSRKTQVTVSRAIHVLSTEDQPRQVVSQRDRTCRNLENEEIAGFLINPGVNRTAGGDSTLVSSRRNQNKVEWEVDIHLGDN